MYNPKSKDANEFISHEEVLASIAYGEEMKNDQKEIERILEKAKERNGITHREAILLLCNEDDDVKEKIFKLAKEIKKDIYGNRIVLFAPLYLANQCVNGCLYCPYHYGNEEIARKKLSQEEIKAETIALQDMGHKRLAIECGEDPVNIPLEYVLESIKTIYSIKHKNGAIRRVNVNIAATTVENYKRLHEAEIGTYILFQETYHKENYLKMHPTGPKHNYEYHTEAMDRAMEGGIDDVGLGVLFGLDLYKYDFTGLLMHAEHLEANFGVGPHTISVPRICPAEGVDTNEFDNSLSDDIFKKIVAILRISAPYVGIIMSTRESEEMREQALEIGVSQVSGASKTTVGGYATDEEEEMTSAQFEVTDNRTLDEVIKWLMETNHVPSFCTACYKEGRTGDRFMRLAKTGAIKNICQPNAILTLKEYGNDYASKETKELIEKITSEELERISNPQVKEVTIKNMEKISNGERDFRF